MGVVLIVQGMFYVTTGLWPVLHMPSFERASGIKVDKWLVKTVGLLLCVSGIIFIRFSDSEAALWLAILDAFVLICIDLYYVYKRVIPKVYVLDSVVEAGFILAYVIVVK
jgi:hypothetical protein